MMQPGVVKSDQSSPQGPNKKGQDYEDILDELGSFGHWQRVIFVLISIADIWGALAMLLPVFVGATPRWHCDRLEGLMRNETSELNITWKTCSYNDTTCSEIGYYDGFTSIVSQWDLVCDKDYASDMISSIQMAGLLLGACIFGQLSDLMGRKKSYFLAFLILIGPGFVSGFAGSWQMYAACRFLVGVGFGSFMVVACVYPLEFVGSRWRMFCGTIGFWGIGQAILALIAYFVRNWRHLAIVTSISGLPYFLLWWVIPESPRWYIQCGRFEEAQAILSNIARRNNKPEPNIKQLTVFAECDKQKTLLTRRYTYLALFRRWQYARPTLITIILWFTTFVCYYGITYNLKNLSGDRYINMLLSGLVDLASMISVIVILNCLGRRLSLATYLSINVVSFLVILVTVVTGNEVSLATVILGFAMLGKSAALGGTYCCQIFSAELFPTPIRNVGVGAGAMAGRIGGIVAPQLVYLGTMSTSAPYITFCVLSVLALPLIFLLPETSGQPLEDIVHTGSKPTESAQMNDERHTRMDINNLEITRL